MPEDGISLPEGDGPADNPYYSGTCGGDSFHCSLHLGCQAGYGICWDEVPGSVTGTLGPPPAEVSLPPQEDSPVPSAVAEPPSPDDEDTGDPDFDSPP